MYRYFIAYVWSVGPSHGFGSLVVDASGPVRTADTIAELAKQAEGGGRLPEGTTVVITNIVSLDWPS